MVVSVLFILPTVCNLESCEHSQNSADTSGRRGVLWMEICNRLELLIPCGFRTYQYQRFVKKAAIDRIVRCIWKRNNAPVIKHVNLIENVAWFLSYTLTSTSTVKSELSKKFREYLRTLVDDECSRRLLVPQSRPYHLWLMCDDPSNFLVPCIWSVWKGKSSNEESKMLNWRWVKMDFTPVSR